MKKKHLFCIFALLVFCFCGHKEKSELITLEWILGEWISDEGTNITKEFWHRVSPYTYEGGGLTVSKLDKTTISTETLRLVVMSGEIYYIAKVSHNEFPVSFRLTSHSDSSFIFENKTHDFPKKIGYKCINKNLMNVMVCDGKKEFEIKFIRQK